MKERPALRKKIDALYAGPRDDFVGERNALAKALKREGRGEEADHVGGLKKPSVAAALVNRLAHERAAEMKAFTKAAAALRKASVGRGGGLREAARGEREAAAALADAADDLLEQEGGGASVATRERVIETIQAAAADPELEKQVVAGRLVKEQSIASVGFALGAELDDGAEGKAEEKEPAAAERKRAERERAERELKAAEKRVHAAKEALKKANAAKKLTGSDLLDAEKQMDAARAADREAAAAVVDAEHDLQAREAELNDL